MKSILLIVLGLLIGGVFGVVGGGVLGAGAGAGAGIATGLKAGACLTLDAAREQGLITAAQEADFLAAAARQIASEDPSGGPSASAIDCAEVVAELRRAAAE